MFAVGEWKAFGMLEPGQDFGNGLRMNEGSPVDRVLAAFIVCHLDILPCAHCNWITNMLILHLWDMYHLCVFGTRNNSCFTNEYFVNYGHDGVARVFTVLVVSSL